MATMGSPLIDFLKIYFDFAFTLATCPFRLEVLPSLEFSLKTFWPQKLCCALKSILSIFWAVGQIRYWAKSKISKNPTIYFEFTLTVISFTLDIIGMKNFWLNSNKFVELGNTLLNGQQFKCRCNQHKFFNPLSFIHTKLFGIMACCVYLCMCFLKLCYPETLIFKDDINNGTVSKYKMVWWWNILKKHGNYIFLFNEDKKYSEIVETICGFFATIAYVSRYIYYSIDYINIFAVKVHINILPSTSKYEF